MRWKPSRMTSLSRGRSGCAGARPSSGTAPAAPAPGPRTGSTSSASRARSRPRRQVEGVAAAAGPAGAPHLDEAALLQGEQLVVHEAERQRTNSVSCWPVRAPWTYSVLSSRSRMNSPERPVAATFSGRGGAEGPAASVPGLKRDIGTALIAGPPPVPSTTSPSTVPVSSSVPAGSSSAARARRCQPVWAPGASRGYRATIRLPASRNATSSGNRMPIMWTARQGRSRRPSPSLEPGAAHPARGA